MADSCRHCVECHAGHENYAIDLVEAGPLLCAGITVYSPLRRWGVSSGKKLAIVGMGGLGHLAVKLGTALGAEVTVFTTSPDKIKDAKRFGAKEAVVNKDGADFSGFKYAFDFALDTVPYKHDLNRFIPLLKPNATYCRVGVGKVADSNEIGQMNLVLYRNALAGSNTGFRDNASSIRDAEGPCRDFDYSEGLIKLGRIDSGGHLLKGPDSIKATIELIRG